MNWWDNILIFISACCTIFSMYGAYKANTYYKKSKQLVLFANTNIAFVESQKIITTLTELLKLANARKRRGINYINEISQKGESIKLSINKMRETLPVAVSKKMNSLLNSQQTKVESYIDSIITCSVLVDERLNIDDDFNNCRQAFFEIQLMIRQEMELINNKHK